MDGDVQQHYLAAEQAYGDGDFAQAESIASTLLAQLEESSSREAEEEARLAWRAFVALLLGHIHFHGLNQPEQALHHYQLALQSQPPETLRDLAEQGVERCEAQITTTTPAPNPVQEPSVAPADDAAPAPMAFHDPGLELIRDPFLGSAAASPSAPVGATPSATPWLGDGVTEDPVQPGVDDNPAPAPTAFTGDAPMAEPDQPAPDTHPTDNVNSEEKHDTLDASLNTVQTNALQTSTALTDTGSTDAELDTKPAPERTIAAKSIDLTPWLLRRTIAFNND
ncbi:hypothetical protein [Synechococcus sp. RS9916]|uniref:hypothetical protein n=1 Tax=Synechococcus sp. RS9916 TaxID=221359 RepID=UPI0000E53958|nr:hypothetical protein [Synechococcus sp. RS9916]EAU75415.1 hypothetical protein RS9916_37947 [Synechococcus sp. RS9916]